MGSPWDNAGSGNRDSRQDGGGRDSRRDDRGGRDSSRGGGRDSDAAYGSDRDDDDRNDGQRNYGRDDRGGHGTRGHESSGRSGGGQWRRDQERESGHSVERMEPWVTLRGPMRGPRVWSGDVDRTSSRHKAGTMVAVYDQYQDFRGWGFYHPHSRIAVRLVTRNNSEPTEEFWHERARAAAERRLEDPDIPNQVCRILHAEGDDFPALTMDRYGELLVAEAYSEPMADIFEMVLPTFHEVLGTKEHRVVYDETAARAEGGIPFERRSAGCPPRFQFEEGAITYEVFQAEGHKTGFFCDQRENRARLAALVKRLVDAGNPPSVLDVCSYTGGFSLSAAAAGASEVRGIDLDEKAIEQAKRNANINHLKNIKFTHADAFSYLRTLANNGKQFDIVIVDPPKFIRSRRDFEEGKAKYNDINKLAIPLVKEGGFYISCSCSGLLEPLTFQEIIRRAARLRTIRVLRETGAGPDHPVRIDFPEGRYLKALWMQLD